MNKCRKYQCNNNTKHADKKFTRWWEDYDEYGDEKCPVCKKPGIPLATYIGATFQQLGRTKSSKFMKLITTPVA